LKGRDGVEGVDRERGKKRGKKGSCLKTLRVKRESELFKGL